MIQFFHNLGNSWIAKIICGALGLSMMAFWGLGGISLSSGTDNTAALVGKQKISMAQLNQAVENKKNQIRQLTGTYLSNKQLVEMGLLDQVIQEIVAENLSHQIQDNIGLIASDKSVRKYVEYNPLFQDKLGHFDSNLFYAYLGQMKMNQEQLAEKLKVELASQHLNNALMKSVPQNAQWINMVADNQKETRKISYLVLKPSDITVPNPTHEELKEYYEAYQENFATPEYRKIHLLSIQPEHFKADKEKAFEVMYQTSQKLEDLLGAGTSLKEAAQQLGLLQPSELIIEISGKNQQGKLADPRLEEKTILQEIFVLSPNEATSLIDYKNGSIVAEVIDVIPVAFQPFENVKGKVLDLYKSEQQKEKLPEESKKVLEKVINQKSWAGYTPITKTLNRKESEALLKPFLSKIFAQKTGNKNAQLFTADGKNIIVVVENVFHNNQKTSEKEKVEALQILGQDLNQSVQQNFMQDFPIQIQTEAIKKIYTVNTKDEE